jgi:hypothetical protein
VLMLIFAPKALTANAIARAQPRILLINGSS